MLWLSRALCEGEKWDTPCVCSAIGRKGEFIAHPPGPCRNTKSLCLRHLVWPLGCELFFFTRLSLRHSLVHNYDRGLLFLLVVLLICSHTLCFRPPAASTGRAAAAKNVASAQQARQLHAVSAAHRCPAALVLAKCRPAAWTSIASAHPEEIARLTDPAPADVPRMPSPRAVLRASSTTARLYGAVRLR